MYQFIYTDGSKNRSYLGVTFYSFKIFITCRLPKYCSILSAELAATLLILEHVAYFYLPTLSVNSLPS